MHDSIDVCITNALRTTKGSLPLFRGFGLGVTDQTGRLRRSTIQALVAEYYPDVKDLSIEQLDQNTYKINVRGRYYEAKQS